MKSKIIFLVLAFVVALYATLLTRAPFVLILPLFVTFYALFDSLRNVFNKKNVEESKQLIFVSSCGLACLLSLTTIFNDNGYKLFSYIIFCLGFLGLLGSLMLFTSQGENK